MSTPTPTAVIAARVRAARDRAGLSSLDLADYLGMPLPTLYRRLSGVTPFRVAELQEIAGYLGVPVTELLDPDPRVSTR